MSEKLNIIDVGCGQKLNGEWEGHEQLVNFFLGFDPSLNVDQVKDKFSNNLIYNCAVFNEEGVRPFYNCNYARNSSLFPPNKKVVREYVKKKTATHRQSHRFDIKEIKEVKCVRLDTIISDLDFDFDFVKIDTQGAEYNVIKSLGEYLGNQIVGIKTEVFFKQLYEGIKLYDEIDSLLKSSGFKRIKKIPISFGPARKFCADFLYIREDSSKLDKIKLIRKVHGVG